MTCVRRDFGERFEHEAAFVQARMRDRQRRNLDDGAAEKQNVYINCARGFLLRFALATHALLDSEDGGDQLARHFFCVEFDGTVEEPGLANGHVHWLGFVKRRDRSDMTDFAQLLDRSTQVGFAVAQI